MSVDLAYYSFNEKRADEKWKTFPESSANSFPEDPYKEQFLLEALGYIDLDFGGIPNELFDSNKTIESVVDRILSETFKLKNEDGIPLVSEWVKFYENLNTEIFDKFVKAIAQDNDWDEEESKAYAINFLEAMRPIAKDLKDNPDSILVLTNASYYEFTPKSSDKILKERAQKHLEQFKEILPKVS